MWTLIFWKRTIERAVKSFLGGLVTGGLGAQAFNIWTADWGTILSASASLALVSVVFSLLSAIPGDSSNPSLVAEPVQGD